MRKIITLLILAISTNVHATQFLVSNPDQGDVAGSLRRALRAACTQPGDDKIQFDLLPAGPFHLKLSTPLVIRQNCQGKIALDGTDVSISPQEVVLEPVVPERFRNPSDCDPSDEDCLYRVDGEGPGQVHGDSCILNVYSDGHMIRNLTFLGNGIGSRICLFGRNNHVMENRFGTDLQGRQVPSRYGVVVHDIFSGHGYPTMDGSQNIIERNKFGPNIEHGIWVHADDLQILENEIKDSQQNSGLVLVGDRLQIRDNVISNHQDHGLSVDGDSIEITGNQISGNGFHGIWIRSADSIIKGNEITANGARLGIGIFIESGSRDLQVGGDWSEEDRNIIQNNGSGGIFITGEGDRITITHNIISRNGALGVDLGADGVTLNDWLDLDLGPNDFLNRVDHFQYFPLGNDAWGWGVAKVGERLEVYSVPREDWIRGIQHGGGEGFLGDVAINPTCDRLEPCVKTFELDASSWNGVERATLLSFDEQGNTSEYSLNYGVGADADFDGILDGLETGNSDPNLVDTDEDGLPDPVEDVNRNGLWDHTANETKAYAADTDGDGLSDWAETHGDGIYDVGMDTNPFHPDTDGDSLADGQEDPNNNGIVEAYLGETSPLRADSDQDGSPDASDNCPVIANPAQESWYCF